MNWSCKLTLWQRERDGGGGQPPVKSEVRAQSNTVGRLWFFGGRCSRILWKRSDEQGRSELEGFPGSAQASTPKPESVCLTILCLSPTLLTFSSVQFSRSVVSDSLWPHESQHTRPPCPSPTPGVHGGYPRPPFSGKSPLRALVNKSPGHDRSVSIKTPLMAF